MSVYEMLILRHLYRRGIITSLFRFCVEHDMDYKRTHQFVNRLAQKGAIRMVRVGRSLYISKEPQWTLLPSRTSSR